LILLQSNTTGKKTLKEKSKSHPQENFKKNKNQKKENFVIDQ
jgi:hypothetical protein